MKHKQNKKAILPADFNIVDYIQAFRLLNPPTISNITPSTPVHEVLHWANDAFWKYIELLRNVDMVRQNGEDEKDLLISYYAESTLVKMNILPIVIYDGVKITFSDYEVNI